MLTHVITTCKNQLLRTEEGCAEFKVSSKYHLQGSFVNTDIRHERMDFADSPYQRHLVQWGLVTDRQTRH